MCDRHYRKLIKYGDPLAGRFIWSPLKLAEKKELREYIRERISVDGSGCWTWKNSCNELGYGICCIERRPLLAHRVSAHAFGLFNIESPLLVCHRCDTPNCVNPKHLFIGNNADNIRDMYEKGRNRHLRGEEVNTAKLTAYDAMKVRWLRDHGLSRREISERLGIDRGTVGDIVTMRSWNHV